MVAAVRLAGVAGMLVLRADRLDEADLRELAVGRRVEEVLLVLQVRAVRAGGRVVAREVGEGIVVLLVRPRRAVWVAARCPRAVGRRARSGAVRRIARGTGARGPAATARVAGSVVPATAVVGPADATVGHQVADRQVGSRVIDRVHLVREARSRRLVV